MTVPVTIHLSVGQTEKVKIEGGKRGKDKVNKHHLKSFLSSGNLSIFCGWSAIVVMCVRVRVCLPTTLCVGVCACLHVSPLAPTIHYSKSKYTPTANKGSANETSSKCKVESPERRISPWISIKLVSLNIIDWKHISDKKVPQGNIQFHSTY